MIKEATKGMKHVKVASTDGLVVDYANKIGAKHLIRGLRAVSDFEYEFQLNAAYKYINKDIDVVFFMSDTQNSFISSSTNISIWSRTKFIEFN